MSSPSPAPSAIKPAPSAIKNDTLSPRTLGGLTLSNPLVMAPVKTGLGALGGAVTEPLTAYYARRARGGAGALIVEPLFVDPAGKEHPRQLGAHDDALVPGLRDLVGAIHDGGSKAIAHLNHAGRAANPKATKRAPEAPSAVPCPTSGATPEVLTVARVEALIDAFGAAARRAREAGFDAIELQFGLGYLVAQFLSPHTNQRQDGFGGDLEGRRTFGRRVFEAVRAAAGPDLPILARLSATEKVEGGLDLDDALATARWLAGLGVAGLHVVSGSACDTPPWYYQHMSLPPGVNADFARRVKSAVAVPVMAAGRLGEPAALRALLESGAVDLVALGRALVADPDLPNKLLAGRDEVVVQCGGCLQGCLAGVKAGRGIGCIVNPEAGREHLGEAPPRQGAPKRVVVIGGGPAGLTAARVAAERGHDVTLLERHPERLGGQLAVAHLAPGKGGMERMTASFVRHALAAGARVERGVEATPESVRAMHPDAVVVAVGAEAVVPPIPGLQEAAVSGLDGVEALLRGERPAGGHALVLGGGLIGVELAEKLAEGGTAVTLVEQRDTLAHDMEMITRKLTMRRLTVASVEVRLGATLTRVEPADEGAGGQLYVTVRDAGGEERLGPFDTVAVAAGTRPLAGPWADAEAAAQTVGAPVYTVGDARELGQVEGAVRSAWEVARTL